MARGVVQDSDEEPSDGSEHPSPEAHATELALDGESIKQFTKDQPRKEKKSIIEGLNGSNSSIISTESSILPVAIPLAVEPSLKNARSANVHDRIAPLTPDACSFTDSIIPEESHNADSQKRTADADVTDDDELAIVPARKRHRLSSARPEPVATTDAWERASMPPPGSQDSISAQNPSAYSFRSASSSVRIQPSPPRLLDNMSFTTTGSASFRGSRAGSVQMFPALDTFSFQQRLIDMDIDQPTDIDSVPASQQDFAMLEDAPAASQGQIHEPVPQQDQHGQSKKAEEISPEPDPETKEVKRPSGPATLIRIEVAQREDGDADSAPENDPIEATSLRKKRGRPRKKGNAHTIVDAAETGVSDVGSESIQVKTNSKTKKKRGRTYKEPSPEVEQIEESEAEETPRAKRIDGGAGNNHKEKRAAPDDTLTSPDEASGPITPSRQHQKLQTLRSASKAASPEMREDALAVTSPQKHSPLSSGSVPLRVGLSKRVRIEPLLKVVRK